MGRSDSQDPPGPDPAERQIITLAGNVSILESRLIELRAKRTALGEPPADAADRATWTAWERWYASSIQDLSTVLAAETAAQATVKAAEIAAEAAAQAAQATVKAAELAAQAAAQAAEKIVQEKAAEKAERAERCASRSRTFSHADMHCLHIVRC